ncbi:glycosyl transferase, group 1 family protein [Marinobacter sp. ELB17]|nr:glycosyl transferase, group 1 family protein [Marinobacter sp. ELB17]
MKIAFILGGGTYWQSLYRVTSDVAEEIRKQGHQVDFVFWENPGPIEGNDKYLKIFGLNKESKLSKVFSKPLIALLGKHFYHFLFSPLFCWQLKSKLQAEKYQAIFYHGMSCIPLHADKDDHYVVVHSCKYENFVERYTGVRRHIFRWLYKKIYSGKKLLTVSQDVQDDMTQKIGARPESIENIYNGFDFDRLKAEIAKPAPDSLPDSFIMSAGRPDRTKRFDILLRAYAKSNKTYPLVIFGDGKRLNQLKQLANELGIAKDVFFAGFCNNLLPAFRRAKLYVSSSDVEGLPTVIVESLVACTPVVATDAGGCRELLNGELSKWVVPRRDIDALARAMNDILQNPPEVSYNNIAFLDYRRIAKHYIALSEQLKGHQR